MARRRHRKHRRHARENPLGDTAKLVLYGLGAVAVVGAGYLIYTKMSSASAAPALTTRGTPPPNSPAGGSTGGASASGGPGSQTAADAAAAQAKAVADAVAAATAAAAATVKAAQQAAAVNNVKSAIDSRFSQGGGNSSAELNALMFIAGIQAAQAAGIAPGDVLNLVWSAAVAWFMSRGYGSAQAQGFATAAQQQAGFGTHQNAGPGIGDVVSART